MMHRAAIAVTVERTVQFSRRQLVERREETLHRACAVVSQLAGYAVKFAAVAGGKDQRFFQDSTRTQLVGGFARLLDAERDTLAQLDSSRAMIQANEDNFHLRNARLIPPDLSVHTQSEVTVKVRKIPVHDAVTENHEHEIKDAQRRSARSTPCRRLRQKRITDVDRQNQNRDDNFRIAIPIPALQPVRPYESGRHSNGERPAPNQNTATGHSLEDIERRETPPTLPSLWSRRRRFCSRKITLNTKEIAKAEYAKMLSVT